jgi:hypothetical protein
MPVTSLGAPAPEAGELVADPLPDPKDPPGSVPPYPQVPPPPEPYPPPVVGPRVPPDEPADDEPVPAGVVWL